MKILSLGWGVQSFTLAAMCALGEIEKPDYAIHADTGHEGSGTYDYAAEMTPWLEARGVKVVTVARENRLARRLPSQKFAVDVPAFTVDIRGKQGQIRRQCTNDWKIVPMYRWLSQELKRQGKTKTAGVVEMWLGISTDESLRMKPARVQYVVNRWPLIERGMSRQDCKDWLEKQGLPEPPRSACVFCPYHTTAEWRDIQQSIDWHKAVAADKIIRDKRPPNNLYVHPARIPLSEIDFRTEQEKGQLSLWDEECEGMCGI